MNPEEDPEAVIRRLERPLADHGAVELGATTRPAEGVNPTAQLPPPVYSNPYNGNPYSAPPFGVSYPPVRKKGAPIGLIFGVIAVLVVLGFGAFAWWAMSRSTPHADPDVRGGSIRVAGPPTAGPSAAVPTAPEVTVVPSGEQVSVAGVDKAQTLACDGGNVSVSGVNNTVTITGHCAKVNVSGVDNKVSVDNADRIDASGFDNRVVFHSGTPTIDSTSSNTVSQG